MKKNLDTVEPWLSLYQGSTVSRFFFKCITITGLIKIVPYTEDFIMKVHYIEVPQYHIFFPITH